MMDTPETQLSLDIDEDTSEKAQAVRVATRLAILEDYIACIENRLDRIERLILTEH